MEIGSDAHWVLPARLMLSRAPRSAAELSDLKRAGITHVLTLLEVGAEAEWAQAEGLRLLSCPIEEMGPPSVRALAAAVSRTASVLASPRSSLLVHCHAGVGRSGAVAASYLGAAAGIPADRAVAWVRGKRPQALWSPDKVEAVEAFLKAWQEGSSGLEGRQTCRKCGLPVLRPFKRCFACSKLPSLEDFFDQDPSL